MALLRSVATVGGYTMVSRVLGFVRDVLVAAWLGAGPVADAFFVAFKFPNFFRRLFAEGAFNAAFVPSFARIVVFTLKSTARMASWPSGTSLNTMFSVSKVVVHPPQPACNMNPMRPALTSFMISSISAQAGWKSMPHSSV